MDEVWRPIPDIPYEASNRGRVRRVDGRVMSNYISKKGYMFVGISVHNIKRNMKVARCVCLAFHGKPSDPSFESAHLNGNRTDDRPENLAWVTHKENVGHQALHGTKLLGADRPNSKLTDDKVIQIRNRFKNGESKASLARAFDVSFRMVSNIVNHTSWVHVPDSGEEA